MIRKSEVSPGDIEAARQRLQGVAHRTCLDYSSTFSSLTGLEIYLKLENTQRTGSFKIRGAFNKISSLAEKEKAKGVVAASAGNHAQGVAFAASKAGIPSTIVMPQGVSIAKLTATRGYGAKIILGGQSYDEAYAKALSLQEETGAAFVHAFDDPFVIAGQGTVGREIMEDLPEVENILAPVGGGGLMAGVAVAVKSLKPKVRLIGVKASHPETIADGIAVKQPGRLNTSIINQLVDDIITVNDEEIAQAILMLLERSKLVCEGAGAVALAAVLSSKVTGLKGRTALIISGGNIDVHVLSIIIERGLTKAGRYIRLNTVVTDRPGALQKLLAVIAATRANVISVTHDRIQPYIPITRAEVGLVLETRDPEHVDQVLATLKSEGYEFSLLN